MHQTSICSCFHSASHSWTKPAVPFAATWGASQAGHCWPGLCPHRSAAFLESALELQRRFPRLAARKLITTSSLFKRKWKQPSHWSLWYLNNCTAVLWAGFTTLGKMLQSILFECRSSLFNIKCVYHPCFKWTSLFIQSMQLIEVVLEIYQSL